MCMFMMCIRMYVYICVCIPCKYVYVYVCVSMCKYVYIYELHPNLNRISVGSYITVRISVTFGLYGVLIQDVRILGLF